MGYELNKLMRQFGVSTPGVANYAGEMRPMAPTAPAALPKDATEQQRTDYNTAKAAYDAYAKDPSAFNALMQKYNANQQEYDAYRRAYQDRVANTPMYMDAQFQTGPSAAVAWNTAQGGGRDAVNKSITDWVAQNPAATPQQIRAAMDKYGISGYDVAQARGGSMWGEPLRPPTYAAQPVGGGINLSTTPISGGSTVTLPSNLNIGGDFSGVDWTKVGNIGMPQQVVAPASTPTYSPPTQQLQPLGGVVQSAYGPNSTAGALGASHIVDGVQLVPGAPGYDPNAAAMRLAEISTYGGSAGAGAADTLRANNLYDTGMSQWQTELNRLHQQDIAAERLPVGTPAPVAAAPTTPQMPAMYDQSYVNQLVREAAAQAGGTLSYADAANAARNLGIPESMLQGAMSTGVISRKRGGAVRDLAEKYRVGGVVRKFQIGGARGEEEDPMETFLRERNLVESGEPPVAPAVVAEPAALRPVAPPVTDSPAVQPVTPPPAATTPVSPAAMDLMSMLQRYAAQDSVYAPELKAARQRAEQESAAFQKMIADATKADTAPPDKTEMYFRLAAAFGAPTKTGHFSENLGMVGKELGEYAKERRTAAKADKQLRLQLGLEAQKLRAQGAREDLTTLRTLAGEEMKDKRAIMQEYLKSGRPQSEAGKIAQDAGLQPGTEEYTKFVKDYVERKMDSGELYKQAMLAVAQGNLALNQTKEARAAESATKLTPAEVKLKSEAEVAIGSLDDAMGSLKRAYSLNPNTFDGTWSSIAQQKVLEQTDPKDPRVLATREQRNLLSKGAISNLRAAFGGNPTEGERNALLDLEGLDSKSKEERARIMKNTYSLLKQRRAREQKRLNEISQGLYRETTPSAGDLE